MKKKSYIIVICILAAVLIGSAAYLGIYFYNGKKQADRFNELSEQVHSTQPQAPSQTTEPTDETEEKYNMPASADETILEEYRSVHAQNPDMVGWIQLPGTVMDYPVMQTSVDNANFYLYRNFDKEGSDRGSIYIREECDILAPSDNITIYGHNMKDGSMFACLGEYYDKEYWEENNLIFFDNLYEYHAYQIFAVFKTTTTIGEGFRYHNMIDAKDEADFNEFISTCKELSFYDTGITPKYGDKIICLSTCEYTLENGRFVVAAVRIT